MTSTIRSRKHYFDSCVPHLQEENEDTSLNDYDSEEEQTEETTENQIEEEEE